MVSVLSFLPLFPRVGLAPALVTQTVPFLKALVWSTLPLALYFALRRYLQAMHIVKPVVFALISANLVNLLGNWVLVYGHLGARGHGVAGSGWSHAFPGHIWWPCWRWPWCITTGNGPADCGALHGV